MKHPKLSLCASCNHFSYCSLTNDKEFIWSCSEYEDENHMISSYTLKPELLTKQYDFAIEESKI